MTGDAVMALRRRIHAASRSGDGAELARLEAAIRVLWPPCPAHLPSANGVSPFCDMCGWRSDAHTTATHPTEGEPVAAAE